MSRSEPMDMQYTGLIYSLLVNQFWSITPALPSGSAATRLEVGFPETIPEKTFIARELNASDGFPAAQRNHMNAFIQGGRQFHLTYGLAPKTVNSFQDILEHFKDISAPIKRIRIVSHGNDAFLFFPIFNGGLWSYGMHTEYLQALQDSDEGGLRYLFSGQTSSPSPLLIDSTDEIIAGMTALNNTLVTPLGSPISSDVRRFVEAVNDLYQVKNGAVTVGNNLITATQQGILNSSLELIETAVRSRIAASGAAVSSTDLNAFKSAVLAANPIDLGFLGSVQNLPATVIADLQTALGASPRDETDIRTAFGRVGEPIFFDRVQNLVIGLGYFQASALNLGGTARDFADIAADAELYSFAVVGSDLNFLKVGGRITIGGAAVTAANITALRNGLIALAGIISARILARAGNTITVGQLNSFRSALENLTLRQSGVTGGFSSISAQQLSELNAANQAMRNNFRVNLDHFRGLMLAADASVVDIRGCMVGKTPAFLDLLRDFLGTAANKPTITAPEWWQSFPSGLSLFQLALAWPATSISTIAADIGTLVANGSAVDHISNLDVDASFIEWRALIDFDPHYDFIVQLFGPTASKRDFAALGWRLWRIPPATIGIPMLRMQARRVDDLDTLNLGDTIERFRQIFEVPGASAPDAAVRGRLNQLQPHLVTFKTKSDAVAAGPAAGDLPQLAVDLTALATAITSIAGFPAPAALLPPAGNSLAEIQTSVANIGAHLDSILNNALSTFFTAVQGKTGLANNAAINYWYNIGLPLLLRSSTHPASFRVSVYLGCVGVNEAAATSAAVSLCADAFRSWMRIQWKGTAVKAADMNAVIQSFAITNNAQRGQAAQAAMFSDGDPLSNPPDAAICPMKAYDDHLVTRPIQTP